MHDHLDGSYVAIHKHIITAMGVESVALIDGGCFLSQETSQLAITQDLIMTSISTAVERTFPHWQGLLDAAELEIMPPTQVYNSSG